MTDLMSFGGGYRAAVFGASGGIGGALAQALEADPACAALYAGARAPASGAGKRRTFRFDLTDEASIQAAAETVCADGPPDLAIVATGFLHDAAQKPEKTLRALDPAALARAFQLNAIGPALIAKHLLFRLPRDRRCLFAALSARVGSISDNQKGGWHGYRASKAALNQLIRTAAIELAVRNPLALCVGLHPGTVDTGMSKPFQSGVAAERLFTPERSAAHLLQVMDRLTPEQTGLCFAWDGQPVPA